MEKFVFGIIAVVFGAIVILTLLYYTSAETVTITVTDKERIVESNGESTSSKYLVFTDTEVFENTDDLFLWKFNSSDVQGKLKVGEKYTVLVIGWRVPLLSMYRNIVNIE
jgi:hypothetical protein